MRLKKRHAGLVPEMNVTPLVDVVLVLLIIFMVIAPQLEGGVRVELPGFTNPDPKVKGALEPLLLTATAEGQLFIDKVPIDEGELEAHLRQTHEKEPERRLLLKGDQSLTYGRMRDLFGRGQKAGFPGISLVVGDRARAASSPASAAAEGGGGEEWPSTSTPVGVAYGRS